MFKEFGLFNRRLHRTVLFSVAIASQAVSLYGQTRSSPTAVKSVVKQQGAVPFSEAPIHYRSEKLDDPVARLQKKAG